ncbi:MAG: hypothetical protein K6A36_06745 [Paludibacteraceae bacterium]|nr:hypothetical protein [Paludibacteraceae bacterium]
MKKLGIILIALLAAIAVQAQFIAQMSLMTPHYYPGEVFFKDGHSEEFEEVELPRSGKGKLSVRKKASDKGKREIEAIDIVGIKIWHKNFPDKVHVLYYVPCEKAQMHSEHQWGNPVMGSAWGTIFQCEINYQMDKKTGELEFVKFVGGTGPNTPTLYYLLRPGWDKAQLVRTDYHFVSKKKIEELFAEKEEIVTAIKKGKLKATDLQYILDEMAGGMQENEQTSIPSIQTDSVTNGEVGDDE